MAAPPPMPVDMRHTKISAEDAALIAGEIVKPSWASRNEGIHERISFNDTLWGFELAGGAFYKTPLRVVYVKPGSRAEQACIRLGDTVLKINGIDTSTLTLQEAHDIVLESGIHLKISVTSPDDEDDAYYTYEDPLMDENYIAEQLRKAMEAERIRKAIEKASRSCNLPWPWVRRKIIIYRESNCFMVPSKFENRHKDIFPELPHVRYTDDICEFNKGTKVEPKKLKPKENGHTANSDDTEKGEHVSDNEEFDKMSSAIDEKEQNRIIDEILEEGDAVDKNLPSDVDEPSHSDTDEPDHNDINGEVIGPDSEDDKLALVEQNNEETKTQERTQEIETIEADNKEGFKNEENSKTDLSAEADNNNVLNLNNEIPTDKQSDETDKTSTSIPAFNVEDGEDEAENEIVDSIAPTSDYVNEDDAVKSEEDNIVDGIVGDGDSKGSINER